MKNKKASIVIPVFNENDCIIEEVKQLLKLKFCSKFEIIIVDDGSTDGTKEKLIALEKKNTVEFILLQHESNKGYGAALKTGILQASTEHIIITDADNSYPNHIIPDLFKEYKKNSLDMVVGARTTKNAALPLLRRPPKWVLNRLANYLTRTKIPDLNSGLRVFRRDVVLDHFNLICDGFSFTTTLTLIMLCESYNVKYIPIDYYKRSGKSKIKPIRDTINFLYLICSTVMYFRPLRVFLPPGLFLLLLSLCVAIYQVIKFQNITTITVIIFQSGFYLLTIALLADLISKNRDVKRHN